MYSATFLHTVRHKVTLASQLGQAGDSPLGTGSQIRLPLLVQSHCTRIHHSMLSPMGAFQGATISLGCL
jgi:hypothetical protein